MPEANRPRIDKDDQDIKGDKDKGIKVIAEVKLNPWPAYGLHTALKSGAFDGVWFFRNNTDKLEKRGEKKGANNKQKGDYEKQSDITIVCQQVSLSDWRSVW